MVEDVEHLEAQVELPLLSVIFVSFSRPKSVLIVPGR